MTLTFKYNTGGSDTNLPLPENPNGLPFEAIPSVAAWRTLNATMKQQYFATKYRVEIKWVQLTATDRNTVKAMFDAGFSSTLAITFPDTKSLSMVPATNGFREVTTWQYETPFFDVSMTLEEV